MHNAGTRIQLQGLLCQPSIRIKPASAQGKLGRADAAALTGLGLLGYYLASFLDFWGLEYISAGLASRVLFILQAGYFKAKTLFFAFELGHVLEDVRHVLQRHYPDFQDAELTVPSLKQTRHAQQRKIFDLFGSKPAMQTNAHRRTSPCES